MVYLLSIGFTLLVVAVKLAYLKKTIRRGRKENLICSGLWLMGLGVVVAFIGVVAWRIQLLESQETEVLTNTGIAIMITGFIPAMQGMIQQKPKARQLTCLCWSIFTIALIGVSSIIWFLIATA